MSNLQSLTIICFLLGAIFPYAFAIKCWDCNSKINKGCDDPFKPDDFAMADCSQKHLPRFPDKEGHICLDSEVRVIRGCGYINETADTIPPGAQLETQCLRRTGTYSVIMLYCACNSGDGCNHSSHLTIDTTITVFLPLVILAILGLK